MTKEWKAQVTSVMKTVTSGAEAMTLPDKPGSGWSCIVADRNAGNGRVLVVSFAGTEVALFYKRQLTEIIPEPGDKTPEGVLQDPREAWQRLDLLGHSAEQSNYVLAQTHRRLEESNHLLTSRAQSLEDLNDELKQRLKTEKTLDELSAEKRVLDTQLKKLIAAKSSVANSHPTKPTPKQKKSPISRGRPPSVRIKARSKHKKRDDDSSAALLRRISRMSKAQRNR
jgi:hypothetical protein